jgi:HPt (histidine-containing phosphotransfer) domain-containing protein
MTIINHSRLNSILLLSVKNQPQILQMLQNLINTAPQNIELLNQFVATEQCEQARQLLHKVRGSFATIGADELARQALLLEDQLAGSSAIASEAIQQFIALYQQSCSELQTVVNTHSNQSCEPPDKVDLINLHQLLLTHNMQAGNVVLLGKTELKQLLPEKQATLFFHLVASLDFAAAARLLQDYLPTGTLGK